VGGPAAGLDPQALRAVRAAAYENDRPEVRALVPPGARRILDLGCSSGAVGAALKAAASSRAGAPGPEVVGIEIDPGLAADARGRLDAVIVGDLEQLVADRGRLEDLGRFDCLVAADVLEHLRRPEDVLAAFAALLEPGATAIVSLPNVRHWETFWQIGVKGTFPRRSVGIFDRTHLRWFTLRDAYALLDAAGLEVVAVDRRARLRPEGADGTAPARFLARTPLRTFVTFQHVIAARRR
jgi:predicted TPR repeat methyltransferase